MWLITYITFNICNYLITDIIRALFLLRKRPICIKSPSFHSHCDGNNNITRKRSPSVFHRTRNFVCKLCLKLIQVKPTNRRISLFLLVFMSCKKITLQLCSHTRVNPHMLTPTCLTKKGFRPELAKWLATVPYCCTTPQLSSSHPSTSVLQQFMTMLLQFVTPLQQGGLIKENNVYAAIFH